MREIWSEQAAAQAARPYARWEATNRDEVSIGHFLVRLDDEGLLHVETHDENRLIWRTEHPEHRACYHVFESRERDDDDDEPTEGEPPTSGDDLKLLFYSGSERVEMPRAEFVAVNTAPDVEPPVPDELAAIRAMTPGSVVQIGVHAGWDILVALGTVRLDWSALGNPSPYESFTLGQHVHYAVYPFGKNIPAIVGRNGVVALRPKADEVFGPPDDMSHFCEWGGVDSVTAVGPDCGCDLTDMYPDPADWFEALNPEHFANGDQPRIEVTA